MVRHAQARIASARYRAASKLGTGPIPLDFSIRTACCSDPVGESGVLLCRQELCFRGCGPNNVALVIKELQGRDSLAGIRVQTIVGHEVQTIPLLGCQGPPEGKPSVDVIIGGVQKELLRVLRDGGNQGWTGT